MSGFVPHKNQPVMTPFGPGVYQCAVDLYKRGSTVEIAETVYLVKLDNPKAAPTSLMRGGEVEVATQDVTPLIAVAVPEMAVL